MSSVYLARMNARFNGIDVNSLYQNPERNWPGGMPLRANLGATSDGVTPTVAIQQANILQDYAGRLKGFDPRSRIFGTSGTAANAISGSDGLTVSLDAASMKRYRDAWAAVVSYLNAHPLADGSRPDPRFPTDLVTAGEAVTWLEHIAAITWATAKAQLEGLPPPPTTAAAIAAGTPSPYSGYLKAGAGIVGVIVLKKLIFG